MNKFIYKTSKFLNFFSIIFFNFFAIFIYFLSGFIPRNKTKWVFSAWEGKAFRGSNMYLFKYLENKDDIKAIWITKNKKILNNSKNKNNIIYAYSIKGLYNLLTAKFIFFSHGMYDLIPFCTRGSKLFCINHVTFPIKDMSFTKYFQNLSFFNRLKSYLISPFDHIKPSFEIVSSNNSKNSTIYLDFNKSKHFNRILPFGLPKSDYLLKSLKISKNERLNLLKKYFPNIKNENKFVLFLPTWRSDESFDLFQFKFDLHRLTKFLSKKNIFMLINFHPFDEKNRLKVLDSSDQLSVSSLKGDEITNLLCFADVFITDYSSLFSDFLLFDRKILFIKFSHDLYVKERKFHIPFEGLPGKIVNDWIELERNLNQFFSLNLDSFKEIRAKWIKYIYAENKDGKSCQRIVNFIQNNL